MPATQQPDTHEALLKLRRAGVSVKRVVKVIDRDELNAELLVLYLTKDGDPESAYLTDGEKPLVVVGW